MGPTERAIMLASQAGQGDVILTHAGLLYVLAGGAVLTLVIGFGIIYIFGNIIIDKINKRLLRKEFEREEKEHHDLYS